MRVQPRPRFRAGASILFAGFADAVEASRELAQSGLNPANCRLLGHDEALMSGSGDGSQSILVLGFESADHELAPWLARALEICASHRGEIRGGDSDPAAVWRASFLRGGHLRDGLVRLGLISETFETAVTWDRFWEFHEGVLAATRQAVRQGGREAVTHWEILESFAGRDGKPIAALLACELETGRTHQIRVHLAHIGHPLMGDAVYGPHFKTKANQLGLKSQAALTALGRQALHAYLLVLEHPRTGELLHWEAPLPEDLLLLQDTLKAAL